MDNQKPVIKPAITKPAITKPAINGKTMLFGCLAHPTSHVRAPTIFNQIFEERGIDAVMVPVDIEPKRLEEGIAGLQSMPNFKGAAVTIPHKMPLAQLCDELGSVAKITGAVNAVRFKDGRLQGDNFDGAGFIAGFYGQGHQLAGKRCLLIGAGGAANAIAYGLCCEPIAGLAIYNRTIEKAEALVAAVKLERGDAPLATVATPDYASYDIVINATPLGLRPDDALPCPVEALSPTALVCDIIMVPQETKWLKMAKDQGLACHLGHHMLDYQIALIGKFIGVDDLSSDEG